MGSNPIVSATNHSRTRDEAPARAFFLFVSKGFSGAIRLSEIGRWPEIGLRTPRVSFHPPFTQIETHSKRHAFSSACEKWITPQLRCVRPLSKRSETPEGGVIKRGSEKALAGWATTRSGDDAPGTAVTGSWTSHSLQLAATTEMRTNPPFASAAIAYAASDCTCSECFAALQQMSPNPSLTLVRTSII